MPCLESSLSIKINLASLLKEEGTISWGSWVIRPNTPWWQLQPQRLTLHPPGHHLQSLASPSVPYKSWHWQNEFIVGNVSLICKILFPLRISEYTDSASAWMEREHFPVKWIWAEEVWAMYSKSLTNISRIKIKRTASEIFSALVMFALPTWATRGQITLARVLANAESSDCFSKYSQGMNFLTVLRAGSAQLSAVTLAGPILRYTASLCCLYFTLHDLHGPPPKWKFPSSWKLSPSCLWLARVVPLFAVLVFGSCLAQC